MTITISPELTTSPRRFQARSGSLEATGNTVGAALDALTATLPEEESDSAATLVIVQQFRPDAFFNAVQQARLSYLLERFNTVRDTGGSLTSEEQNELESLVEAELQGTIKRTQALLDAAP